MKPAVPTARETVTALVRKSRRSTNVQIRRSFLQQGSGRSVQPGALARFVHNHDQRALDLYLLVRLVGVNEPFHVEQPSQVWARALGLGSASSSAAISRLWKRLEDMRLIAREGRVGRDTLVRILLEDGSGGIYSRPVVRVERYVGLPLAYFLDGWCLELNLAEKAMLLVALNHPSPFELPLDKVKPWFGLSAETADQGFRGLERRGLLSRTHRWRQEPLAASGLVKRYRYELLGPFFRKRTTRIEVVTSVEGEVEEVVPALRVIK